MFKIKAILSKGKISTNDLKTILQDKAAFIINKNEACNTPKLEVNTNISKIKFKTVVKSNSLLLERL